MAIEDKVQLYLEKEMMRSLYYGDNDCCLFPANLAKELTGFDPAAPFRGKYDDEVEALRFCNDVGGLPILISRAFRSVGFNLKHAAETGDCGCVHYNNESVGAIFFQQKWWMKGIPDGLIISPESDLRVLAIWNVSDLASCHQ